MSDEVEHGNLLVSINENERTRLYADYLQEMRQEEAKRTAFMIEAITDLRAMSPPKPSPEDERKFWRDNFAAAALTGYLAGRRTPLDERDAPKYAELSYAWADAMLTERSK